MKVVMVSHFRIPISTVIQQIMGCDDIAGSSVRYPVIGHTEYTYAYLYSYFTWYVGLNSEMYHANRWCTDSRFAPPIVSLINGSAFLVRDCVAFKHRMVGTVKEVAVKFFHQVCNF